MIFFATHTIMVQQEFNGTNNYIYKILMGWFQSTTFVWSVQILLATWVGFD